MGITRSCSSVLNFDSIRDQFGVEWMTVRGAVEATGMSESTVKAWVRAGDIPKQTVRGVVYLSAPRVYQRLRESLENPRVKTRWQNRQRD